MHSAPAERPYTSQRAAFSLLKIAPSHAAIWTQSNTVPWTHPSPNPKQHLDRFSRFCTVHDRASLYFTVDRPAPFPLKIAPSHGGSGPHLIHDSLGQFEPTSQAHGRVSLYFIMGSPSPQNAPSHGGIWTPSNTWFPGPTSVLNLNGISIGSAVFVRLTSVTDRQTNHDLGL